MSLYDWLIIADARCGSLGAELSLSKVFIIIDARCGSLGAELSLSKVFIITDARCGRRGAGLSLSKLFIITDARCGSRGGGLSVTSDTALLMTAEARPGILNPLLSEPRPGNRNPSACLLTLELTGLVLMAVDILLGSCGGPRGDVLLLS